MVKNNCLNRKIKTRLGHAKRATEGSEPAINETVNHWNVVVVSLVRALWTLSRKSDPNPTLASTETLTVWFQWPMMQSGKDVAYVNCPTEANVGDKHKLQDTDSFFKPSLGKNNPSQVWAWTCASHAYTVINEKSNRPVYWSWTCLKRCPRSPLW